MHWSGLDRIAKLAKKRGKMIEVHCYSCFYSTFWKSKIDHLDGWPVFYWLRIEKELRLLVMMERYGKIWKKCVFFFYVKAISPFSQVPHGATWCHRDTFCARTPCSSLAFSVCINPINCLQLVKTSEGRWTWWTWWTWWMIWMIWMLNFRF
jgi:hypothetical protein